MKPLHIVNARIHAMAAQGQVFSSMVIDRGRVAELGHDTAARRGTRSLDMGGRTIVPGFWDSHCHFMPSAVLAVFGVTLSGIEQGRVVPDALEGVGRQLKAAAGRNGVVLGTGLVTAGLKEKRMPFAEELDRWLPGRKVVILDSGGHSSSYSGPAIRALKLSGLHDQGVLTGDAHEFNMGRVNRLVMTSLSPFSLVRGICAFVNQLRGFGVTGVHCMEGFDDDPLDLSTRLFAFLAPKLPLHIRLYCQYRSCERIKPFLSKLTRPRIGGCGAWEMDGAVSAGTAAFFDCYRDPDDSRGECYYSEEEADAMVKAAHDQGVQVASHAIGPRAIETLLPALERRAGRANRFRHRIEHFEFPRPDQVMRAARAGIPVSVQPGWSWMDSQFQKSYDLRLTPAQIGSQIPLKTFAAAGGRLCGSSDSPIQPPDPLIQIRGMCEFPVTGQSLSRFEALRAFTVNPAWASGDEETCGTLAPGKAADFLLLNRDILDPKVPLDGLRVLRTFIGGRLTASLTPAGLVARLLLQKGKRSEAGRLLGLEGPAYQGTWEENFSL